MDSPGKIVAVAAETEDKEPKEEVELDEKQYYEKLKELKAKQVLWLHTEPRDIRVFEQDRGGRASEEGSPSGLHGCVS